MQKVFVVGARGIPDVEGGAEKNAERLFPLIAARGWRVILTGLKQHIKAENFQGVELRRAPTSKVLKTDKILYYISAFFIALRERPDIVHMQGLGSAIMLWAYKLMGAKTVVRYGSADYIVSKWGLLGRWGFLLSEFQLRFADAVIAVTPALAERLRVKGIERNVHVIANAVDAPESYTASPDVEIPEGPYVLSVGRVTAQKNVLNLVEGFNSFAANHPEVTLVIAGGLDDEDYVQLLTPLISKNVKLIGRIPRSSLGVLYEQAHIYVNSSMHEGNSNAILEAISWGAPILISDIPENRDFHLPDRHYFDPGDPREVTLALERAHRERETYRVDKSHFLTWDQVADRTLAVYQGLGGALVAGAPSL